MDQKKEIRDYYEIRKDGVTLCSGTAKNMGYPLEWLRDMARNGMHLYKNGKRVKLCELV